VPGGRQGKVRAAMTSTRQQLDLSRPRSLGELLRTTVALFVRHSGLFMSVTLLVVAPVVVLVDGVWGRMLRDGPGAHAGAGASAVSALLTVFVIPPLVTGLHAVIVRDLGRQVVPGIGVALRELGPRLPAAFGAVALFASGAAIGFLLLIVPGVYLFVRWYFAAQAAVLDGTSPGDSLRASEQLVAGRWWPVFGCLVVSQLVFATAGALAVLAVRAIHDPALYVAVRTIVQAIGLSLTALFGTLLFFTLRADRTARETLLRAPERVA
jgi:hypothetical protein